jgi:hypothetical protein
MTFKRKALGALARAELLEHDYTTFDEAFRKRRQARKSH